MVKGTERVLLSWRTPANVGKRLRTEQSQASSVPSPFIVGWERDSGVHWLLPGSQSNLRGVFPPLPMP